MRIKRMTASFGRLDRAQLELGPGLNVIEAANEGGKSTWAGFLKAMLYGVDTRDRDKKGYLADKNRYQPWSGAPMEGEMELIWQGREITLRRWKQGAVPFGGFSAVYTGTEEPVPGLTPELCGQQLLGVGQEVYERSAFLGQSGSLAITSAPELERRIAALVSSGQEDVSYSQVEGTLREWLRRRRHNSTGLIPKLEGELAQVEATLLHLEQATAAIARAEEQRAQLAGQRQALECEEQVHRRLAQRALNRRYAQAKQELDAARAESAALAAEQARFGTLPQREQLKRAQGELAYLSALDADIKQGEQELTQAQARAEQAERAVPSPLFPNLTGDAAKEQADRDVRAMEQASQTRNAAGRRRGVLLGISALCVAALCVLLCGSDRFFWTVPGCLVLGGLAAAAALGGLVWHRSTVRRTTQEQGRILARYGAERPEELPPLAEEYRQRELAAAQERAQAQTVAASLGERKTRRENSRGELLGFVHRFAPEATDLFGCSAALSRALGLEDRQALVQTRLEGAQRLFDALSAQGGREFDTLELLAPPAHTPEETAAQLGAVCGELERVDRALNMAYGEQRAVGDPAALAARREELEQALECRRREYAALAGALEALSAANARLQERFSPELNRRAGAWMAQLTGGRYSAVSLTRELEATATQTGELLPRKALALSRGTVDQLYLAVRLAVCQLCLPGEDPAPLVLDDALVSFDDGRLALALDCLAQLGQERQILLLTCQGRERASLSGHEHVTLLVLHS